MSMFLAVVFISQLRADFTASSVSKGECDGSISLHHGDEKSIFSDGVEVLEESLTVRKAVLEGCGGCFRLFQKKNGRGRSYFVNRMGEHTISLGKVRSIHKVACSNMAMPMWVVIIIVLIIVIVVGVGTVIGVKKFRSNKYDGVQTDQV